MNLNLTLQAPAAKRRHKAVAAADDEDDAADADADAHADVDAAAEAAPASKSANRKAAKSKAAKEAPKPGHVKLGEETGPALFCCKSAIPMRKPIETCHQEHFPKAWAIKLGAETDPNYDATIFCWNRRREAAEGHAHVLRRRRRGGELSETAAMTSSCIQALLPTVLIQCRFGVSGVVSATNEYSALCTMRFPAPRFNNVESTTPHAPQVTEMVWEDVLPAQQPAAVDAAAADAPAAVEAGGAAPMEAEEAEGGGGEADADAAEPVAATAKGKNAAKTGGGSPAKAASAKGSAGSAAIGSPKKASILLACHCSPM